MRYPLAGLLALPFLAGHALADPLTFYVATFASTINGAGYSQSALAQYNYNVGVYGRNATGSYTQVTADTPGGSVTDANNSSNPLLFSSADTSSLSTGAPGWLATAAAHADLASGSIGAAATAQGYGPSGGMISHGSAYLQDQLTFTVAGAVGQTVTDIDVTFSLVGDTVAQTNGVAEADVADDFGNASFNDTINNNSNTGYSAVATQPGESGWVSYAVDTANPDAISFSGVYQLTGQTTTLDVSMLLNTNVNAPASSDFYDTNDIALTLPDNVSYTSQSGVFLTAGQNVPEPASLAVLGLPLGTLLLVRRVLRRAPPAAA